MKTDLQERLFELSDKEYAEFQSKLTPGIDRNLFIGVRVPILRKFAKEYIKEESHICFLENLPHDYYDENMLHALLISEMKDYDEAVKRVDGFLPYVDNWAVCDIMSPKIFKKHKDELILKIKEWCDEDHSYTKRFGIEMLMSFYLDGDFKSEYLEIPANIKSEEYYVNMMIAWFFATALAKQWDSSIKYIEEGRLEKWTHNKAIQKARESYRISDEEKKYLLALKK